MQNPIQGNLHITEEPDFGDLMETLQNMSEAERDAVLERVRVNSTRKPLGAVRKEWSASFVRLV